jgi:hypothetical protein
MASGDDVAPAPRRSVRLHTSRQNTADAEAFRTIAPSVYGDITIVTRTRNVIRFEGSRVSSEWGFAPPEAPQASARPTDSSEDCAIPPDGDVFKRALNARFEPNSECLICMEPLLGDVVCMLPCEHNTICAPCFQRMRGPNNVSLSALTCPMCRGAIETAVHFDVQGPANILCVDDADLDAIVTFVKDDVKDDDSIMGWSLFD